MYPNIPYVTNFEYILFRDLLRADIFASLKFCNSKMFTYQTQGCEWDFEKKELK